MHENGAEQVFYIKIETHHLLPGESFTLIATLGNEVYSSPIGLSELIMVLSSSRDIRGSSACHKFPNKKEFNI